MMELGRSPDSMVWSAAPAGRCEVRGIVKRAASKDRRFRLNLTDDVCAFVFSKEGFIRYICPTETFPRLAVKAGNPLPAECSSPKAPAQPLHVATPWAELDGSVWLQTEWGQRTPPVLEQTMRQSNGFQVSLLFIRAEDFQDQEEEAEISESWEVGFKRR